MGSAGGGRQMEINTLSQMEVDKLSTELTDGLIKSVDVWDIVRKLPDSASGAGDRPVDAMRGCQKCGEAITEDDELQLTFGHFYHTRCVP